MEGGSFVLMLVVILIIIAISIVITLIVAAPFIISKKNNKNNKKKLNDIYSQYGLSDSSINLTYDTMHFIFDYSNKMFWHTNDQNAYWIFWPFDLIIGCDIRINGTVSHSTTTGGVGRAVIGGVVGGGIGAVVGMATAKKKTETITENLSCKLLIYLKYEKAPLLSFDFDGNDGVEFCDRVYAHFNTIVNGK